MRAFFSWKSLLLLSLLAPSLVLADQPKPDEMPTSMPSMESTGTAPLQVDQSDPAQVLEAVFQAARLGRLEILGELCDPLQQNDGDTDCLCALDSEYHPHKCSNRQKLNVEIFQEYFLKARIQPGATISGDEARIPFLFGPTGEKPEEMNLIRRNGLWYLSSF